MSFWLVFVLAFGLSLCLTPLAKHLGRRWDLVDQPGGRRRHRAPTPRLGGLALFPAFFLCGLLIFASWPPDNPDDALRLRGVMLGSVFAFLAGLVDDWRNLSPRWQFVAQFLAALMAIAHTVFIQEVTNPLVGEAERLPDLLTFGLTVFWVMGMMNTVNFLDGLNGLAAGVTTIAAILFAIHSYRLGQPVVALFPTALAGACLGFLPANFRGRIFMGSAGAMTLGYGLATLSILAPARIATALLVMGIPIVDVAWLVVSRWRQGKRPSESGRDHLHFRLLDLGLAERQIVLLYYGFCAFFGSLALLMPSGLYKLMTLIVMGTMTTVGLVWLAGLSHEGHE